MRFAPPPHLLAYLRRTFLLDWRGIHGAPHWQRVHENGLRLADETGADAEVVVLFAYLHDHKRESDGYDPDHGLRAALVLPSLDLGLEPRRLGLLQAACRGHTHDRTHEDVTVRTCYDADRLDLGRVGIRPDPARLCTPTARDPALIAWAWRRSRGLSPSPPRAEPPETNEPT